MESVKQGLHRLNSHEPQHPPDSYFIKASRVRLSKFLEDAEGNKESLFERGSPRYVKRLKLF